IWQLLGVSQVRFLTDWFYRIDPENWQSEGSRTAFLQGVACASPRDQAEIVAQNQREQVRFDLLDTIRVGSPSPESRALVRAIIHDPRFENLDYESLKALVWIVDAWQPETK